MSIHLSIEGVVGAGTVFFAILVKIIGIPDQIRENFKRHSTEGISLLNQTVGFLAYCFWTLYGLLRHDRVLIYGQALGVITTGIILYQFGLYRGRGQSREDVPAAARKGA